MKDYEFTPPHATTEFLMRVWFVLLLMSVAGYGQNFSQRGYLENRATFYPQKAVNDSAQFVGESQLRYETFYDPSKSWQFAAGVDLQIDTHHQDERSWDVSWSDRELQRPTAEARRLTATYHKDKLTLELGKQLIRWGKTDILNPTDRFAPRDYLTVIDNDFIPIVAARATYESGSNTIDVIWSPRFTPSRIPLLNQRWFVPPSNLPAGVEIREGGASFPGGSQEGIRWDHLGRIDFSASYYQGYNNLPLFGSQAGIDPSTSRPALNLTPFYPEMRMIGSDASVPLRWLTLKAEGGYFSSTDPRADEYGLFVVQLERQAGEWFFVGGYAGQAVTREGTAVQNFAPDRGLAQTVLARASYTIDANRSVSFETAARQNGHGTYAKAEYSQAFGQHWRATVNATLIRGDISDFLGQYRLNSHAALILRYSF